MGPLENGLLYIREKEIENIWPAVIGAGWNKEGKSVDEKFCVLGQRNEATAAAIQCTLDFHWTLGKSEIENRVKTLNSYLKEEISEKLPDIKFITPRSSQFSAGVTILEIPDETRGDLFQKLYQKHNIACAPTGGLRFSPHIYNTKDDLDRIVDALVDETS